VSAVAELLARLAGLDIRLALDGDRLSVNAPKGAITADLRAELAARKAELKDHLRAHPAPAARRAIPSLVPVPRMASMPVSHTQQRLWFLRQMDPGSSTYNVVNATRLIGPLDVLALERAFDDVVQRHESLRTRFFALDGVPHCAVESEVQAPMQLIDLSEVDPAQRDDRAVQVVLQHARTPFDLARAPLARLLLVRIDASQHLCCSVVDHIVADGLSVAIMFAELQALYRQRIGGPPAQLPPLTVQYADYVHWQREVLAGGALDEHLAYWKDQLRGLPPVLSLPTDRPRPRIQTHRGARHLEVLPTALAATLKAAARREGVTLYMLMLAAFQILLHRYSAEDDFAVGSVVGARDRPEIEPVVGFFANNIVLRADLSGAPTLRELLSRVRDCALKAYAHQQMPFDLLVEALAPRRDLDHSPLFQVLFVLHTIHLRRRSMESIIAEPQELPLATARFDLAVDVFDNPEDMRVYVEYNTDLFDAASIERLTGHYLRLLDAVVAADSATPVGALAMLTDDEAHALRALRRGRALPPAAVASVHGLVAAQARRAPTAEAVRMDGRGIGYAELDARANRLAHHLLAQGVRDESLVGIYMERSIDMVVALLAVLKAGAAYVPLDPAFPRERIQFMMTDAALSCVLTHSTLLAALPPGATQVLALDALAGAVEAQPAEAPPSTTTANSLAYVIYTSGSTGQPKGVQIEHGAVMNFLRSMNDEPGIAATDRWLSVTTLSFDIAGLEIFGPLSAGATVVLASRATALDGQRLAALLAHEGATILQATPATWRLLLESGWTGARTPRGLKMLCGGEALPRELAEKLLGLPGELWNMYGPTETTIWSTAARVRDTTRPITIGRPIAETSVHVLEPSGLPAPIGVAGELCIGGAGLARGYRNRPQLTAEKFVTITDGDATERVYRTGDLVRMRRDGQIEFVGRRDHQVKLRGFRIELEEIETVLAAHDGLRQCVVAVREDTPGDQRLVAYVVPMSPTDFSADAARATLRRKVPEYMVPNLFVVLDALPLTPNGKVDRKALPAPRVPSITAAPEPLMNPAQARVAASWRDVLALDRVGLRDNFFDLGGHSLLLVKLQARLQRDFATEFPLVELFQRTTVEAQAERLACKPSDDIALQRARARAARQAHA
jgi:amino acid adenylation domain-containing protein